MSFDDEDLGSPNTSEGRLGRVRVELSSLGDAPSADPVVESVFLESAAAPPGFEEGLLVLARSSGGAYPADIAVSVQGTTSVSISGVEQQGTDVLGITLDITRDDLGFLVFTTADPDLGDDVELPGGTFTGAFDIFQIIAQAPNSVAQSEGDDPASRTPEDCNRREVGRPSFECP